MSEKVLKCINRAVYFLNRNKFTKAEDQAERALKTLSQLKMRPSPFSFEIGKILNHIGVKYLQRGDFRRATLNLQKAMMLKREVAGKEHESSIGTTRNLIQSSMFSCSFDLAEKLINELLTFAQRQKNSSLKEYAETQKRILDEIINNKPGIKIKGVGFASDRYTIPALDNLYLPNLFDKLQAIVKEIHMSLIGYETLKCSVTFQVLSRIAKEPPIIDNPYLGEEWKVDAPAPLKSRIPKSSDNFVAFVDDNMSIRKDELRLIDEKERDIQFELKGGLWDIHIPSSYPRFGHASRPSVKIPSCKQFAFFRGKGFVFRWKLDLGTVYKLQFKINFTHTSDRIGVSSPRLGLLFPFKYVSLQHMNAVHPLKQLTIHSVLAKPISYHRTSEGSGIIPMKINASELSLGKINKGQPYSFDRKGSESELTLNQSLNFNDYGMIGLKLSYSPKENLTVWVKTWDQAIPTGIYHTFSGFQKYQVPLVNFRVVNNSNVSKKLLFCTKIESFTQEQRTTVTFPPKTTKTVTHLPPILEGALQRLVETRATNICTKVTELDGSPSLILDDTHPVRLLAFDTMVWEVTNPSTGITEDLSRHILAWITPHTSKRLIEKVARKALELHPKNEIVGYQGAKNQKEQIDVVKEQVKAVYTALKEHGISYVSTPICFGTDSPELTQRVRLPEDSIQSRSANCIDCSVLIASILEHIGLNPAIVLIPGHAFLAWETWQGSRKYQFLETTMLQTSTFEESLRKGWEEWQMFLGLSTPKKGFLDVALLRKDGIFPMTL